MEVFITLEGITLPLLQCAPTGDRKKRQWHDCNAATNSTELQIDPLISRRNDSACQWVGGLQEVYLRGISETKSRHENMYVFL
jgi:hypothetical protein